MAQITTTVVAEQLSAYLHHKLDLEQLVDWAEWAMMDGDFASENADAIRHVVGRLGVADVRAFGLTWEDCEAFFDRLGFSVRIDVVAN